MLPPGFIARTLCVLLLAVATPALADDRHQELLDALLENGSITEDQHDELSAEESGTAGEASDSAALPPVEAGPEEDASDEPINEEIARAVERALEKEFPIKGSYGSKGFRLETRDGNWQTNLQWRFQFRLTHPYQGDPRQVASFNSSQEQTSFQLRRVRMKIGGHGYKPWLKYYFEIDLQPLRDADDSAATSSARVIDWRVDVAKYDPLQLRVGQWKIDYNRERVDSSGRQQFVERSIVNRIFTIDRQMGVSAARTPVRGDARGPPLLRGDIQRTRGAAPRIQRRRQHDVRRTPPVELPRSRPRAATDRRRTHGEAHRQPERGRPRPRPGVAARAGRRAGAATWTASRARSLASDGQFRDPTRPSTGIRLQVAGLFGPAGIPLEARSKTVALLTRSTTSTGSTPSPATSSTRSSKWSPSPWNSRSATASSASRTRPRGTEATNARSSRWSELVLLGPQQQDHGRLVLPHARRRRDRSRRLRPPLPTAVGHLLLTEGKARRTGETRSPRGRDFTGLSHSRRDGDIVPA